MALNSKNTGRLNHSAQVNQYISTATQAPINEDLIV